MIRRSKIILFLDIDGVLNSENYFRSVKDKGVLKYPYGQLDEEAISILNDIIYQTDMDIVISSVWRRGRSWEEFKDMFCRKGFLFPEKIIGFTPVLESGYRGHEIQTYFNERFTRVKDFIIVDDDTDMEPYMDKLIQTTTKSGLDTAAKEKILQLFLTKSKIYSKV